MSEHQIRLLFVVVVHCVFLAETMDVKNTLDVYMAQGGDVIQVVIIDVDFPALLLNVGHKQTAKVALRQGERSPGGSGDVLQDGAILRIQSANTAQPIGRHIDEFLARGFSKTHTPDEPYTRVDVSDNRQVWVSSI